MSDDLISADEARELLSRATRSPWRCYGNAPDDTTPSDEWVIAHDGVTLATLRADDLPECDGAEVAARVEANADLMAAARDLAETVVALHAERDAARAAEHSAIAHAEECAAALQKACKKLAGLRRAVGHVRLSMDHGEDCDSVECVCGLESLEDLAGPVVGRVLTGFGSPTDCREAAGMSLYDAAVASGVSVERIEAIERGEGATGDEFARLVAAYCVPGWVRPEVTP